MDKKIKNKELIKLLVNLGFQHTRTKGAHLIYSFPSKNAIIVMRQMKPNEIVPYFHFASIKKTIIEKGVVSQSEFEEQLEIAKK